MHSIDFPHLVQSNKKGSSIKEKPNRSIDNNKHLIMLTKLKKISVIPSIFLIVFYQTWIWQVQIPPYKSIQLFSTNNLGNALGPNFQKEILIPQFLLVITKALNKRSHQFSNHP